MKKAILIIDDNLNLTTLLSRAMEKAGYDCFVENNSIYAVETAKRVKPDLIILDVLMPGKSGVEILSEMRMDKELSLIPVILQTALAQNLASVAEAQQCDLMNKPADLRLLLENVEKNLGSRPRELVEVS